MARTKQQSEKETSYLLKVPPQSIEAEESLFSAILIDNNALLEVIEVLSPNDFYKIAHQKIYSSILDLFNKNEPVDLVTLVNALKEQGRIEEVGGAAYLARFLDIPLATNATHYARLVYEKACLRRLIEKATAIVNKCFEDSGNLDEILDFAQSSIFEISEKKIKQAFYPLKDIIDDNFDALEERQGKKSLVTGVESGFTDFDALTSGFQNSDLIIIAARPGMGKTAFALNIARNAAVKSNVPVAIFSLEMSKEQLSLRMLCSEAKVDSSRLRGGFLSDSDWVNLTDAAATLSQAPIFIDDSPSISSMEIRAKARRLKMNKGLGLVIIDYLQLMKSSFSAERRDLEIAEMSRSLKALAKELKIPVIALSQLNRKLEDRTDKRPQLADLRESGALEQDADVVAFIYRDEIYNRNEDNPKKNTAEILLRKQRNGPTGEVILTFLSSYTCFKDKAKEIYGM
ncbi:MAG: replicative DNA helicase [Pseudomonadota bacterium]|nr:replicative DNA helicase [Pseudomonadota bacterium]MBU1398881.1 replicative DNA helicase [Pseudomonadota bacterium]MBU1571107.1 replicative DNA helicase [Pseudomonadota bacterium]